MLKAVPMARVAIVGPKTALAATIETLHEMNVLHIDDYSAGDDDAFDLGSPLEGGQAVSERLLKLRGVLKSAAIGKPADPRRFTEANLKTLERRIEEVEDELVRLVDDRAAAADKLKATQEEEALLGRVATLDIRLALLHGYRSIEVLTGFVAAEADVASVRSADPDVEILEATGPGGRFVAVFVRSGHRKAAEDALLNVGFSAVELPAVEATAAERLAQLDGEHRALTGRLGEIDAKIGTINARHSAALHALDELLTIRADKATAPVRFRTTTNSFVVEGWIPEARVTTVETLLAAKTEAKAFVARLPAGADDGAHGDEADAPQPPVKLENPRQAGTYQLLTDTYSRPKYREIDPTLFLYVGFPLFYGFMLGDIGYAILLFILVGTGVFNKIFDFFQFESKGLLNRIMVHAATSSLVFGIVYGELFGLELYGHTGIIAEHAPAALEAIGWPLHRFLEVKLLLLMTVAIGSIHMTMGLLLGMRNAMVSHGARHAWTHRGSWLGILVGLTLVGAAVLPGVLLGTPAFALGAVMMWLGVGALVAGFVLLMMGEGPMGILEIPTLISNMISYSRLLAIGLASAGFALAANQVAAGYFSAGVLGWIFAALILLLGHTVNLALGIIGPALHSLRLHYVEFFTKFYEGGGDEYAPFGFNRKYTQKEGGKA